MDEPDTWMLARSAITAVDSSTGNAPGHRQPNSATICCNVGCISSSHAEDLFSLKSMKIPEFGPWNDSAADGSRMFVRDASTDDIYALDLDFH